MQRIICLLLVSIFSLFLFPSHGKAYSQKINYFCVDGSGGIATTISEDFQLALDDVSATHNDIRLPGGIYTIPGTPAEHFNVAIPNHDLTISGGWNGDCSVLTLDPELTILQGDTTQTDPGGVLSVTIENDSTAVDVTVHNMTIKNGSSEKEGGGLYIGHTGDTAKAATIEIFDIIAELNDSEALGSGISILDSGTADGTTVNISDCIVRNNNFLPPSGGPAGISVSFAPGKTGMLETNISHCQILDNTAASFGSGVYIDSGTGDATLVNNLIAGNTVTDDVGGGIYISNSNGGNTTLTNNTITGNDADEGGGLYVELYDASSTLDIYNNIIFSNTATGTGDDIYIYIDGLNGNTVNIHNNNFNTTQDAGFDINDEAGLNDITADNINSDPAFEDPGNGDYRLASGSPAINEGLNIAPERPIEDLDSVSRPQDTDVDMGAYEFVDTSSAPADEGGQGCFIATAAYGSSMADDVMILRTFRDEHLLTNTAGKLFVRMYYEYSPPIADCIAEHDTLRLLTRAALTPLIFTVKNPLTSGSVFMLLGIFLAGCLVRKPKQR